MCTDKFLASESTEQLDKLLAGLDQLSGTLPDLNNSAVPQQQQQQQQLLKQSTAVRKFPVAPQHQPGIWNGAKSVSLGNIENNTVSRDLAASSDTRANMRSYEDDLDYALEKEVVIKGPERKLLVGTDNYSEVYSDSDKKSNMGTAAPPGSQPYHTRYDSKPFSYIR